MGVASLLHRRQTAAATNSSAAAAAAASGVALRPYRRPAGAEVVVVESAAEWERVWAKLETQLKDASVLGFDCEWVSAGSNGSNGSNASSTTSPSTSPPSYEPPPQPGRVSLL